MTGSRCPAVLAFAAALGAGGQHFVWWRFVLEDVTIGLVIGVVVGVVGGWLMPRGGPLAEGVPAHQRSLYALGTAFAAYGVAALPPHGNGLIAVFVAAITLGIRRPDIRSYFSSRAADLVEIVKLGIFVVFGSLLTLHGLFGDGWAAVGVVARDAARRPPGGGVRRADRSPVRHRHEGVHGLVRAQGRRHDDVFAARPRRARDGGRPDLQPRSADGLLLDHPARRIGHAGIGVAWTAIGATAGYCAGAVARARVAGGRDP